MNDYLIQYYRCPERYVRLALKGPLSDASGYFRFGDETICYGKCCGRSPSTSLEESLYDTSLEVSLEDGTTCLPFDLSQVIDNLRFELYMDHNQSSALQYLARRAYYFARPVLPLGVRKHIQKTHLKGWRDAAFPQWPVDRSVDNVFEHLLLLSLRSRGVKKIPFIWFWPEGASSCAIMTHDVETARGRDFCGTLMDIDDQYGIKASFQIVPENRYKVAQTYLDSIATRGFEVALHDLNHDGHLYESREEFMERASKINFYGVRWGAKGFRAAALYRRQDWFDALEFSYDMSVPNVAHLDPQHGGCCTVMPYRVGKLLELPLTTTQDYSLFHILNDYSINLWRKQIDLIMEKHGLISFIIHPDYIIQERERQTYETLLACLAELRAERGVWITTPGEVNRWWRQRMEMTIIEDGDTLRIEGQGKERARIAYASEQDGKLVYALGQCGAEAQLSSPSRKV